jgi:hypothetical protein
VKVDLELGLRLNVKFHFLPGLLDLVTDTSFGMPLIVDDLIYQVIRSRVLMQAVLDSTADAVGSRP